jgi:two-component system, chemotaxis family, CheB/CheR fusion protein
MVVFAPQNLAADPPFTKLDILSCRNLLIYFGSELQKRLIPLFHFSLNAGGILLLGHSETIGAATSRFHALDSKVRMYRRLGTSADTVALELPRGYGAAATPAAAPEDPTAVRAAAPSLQTLVDRVLVQEFSPLGVLCTNKGDILHLSGRASTYFELAVGKANLNVYAMARDGLRYPLTTAFAAALRQQGAVVVRGVTVGTQTVDVTVRRLAEPKELLGTVMIVIAEVEAVAPKPRPRRGTAKHPRVDALERELQCANELLQTTREEMQTSHEELKSTNEELQSTNEELQSSNEELTTSKEEMQSLNEELQTVNRELESKVDDMSRASNDMKNLLNSTDIATLFLDDELRVRRFTISASKIIKLIASDVGRPITDFASDLDYPGLAEDAREVLRTLVPLEKEVSASDGRWFGVRILPYRTLDNRIDGVVITFSDTRATRGLAATLRDELDELRQMIDALPVLAWATRPDGAWLTVNERWSEYAGVAEREQQGAGWLHVVHPDDRERVRAEWERAVANGNGFESLFRIRSVSGDYRWFETRATAVHDSRGAVQKWYGTSTDVDGLRHAGGQEKRE